MLNASLYSLHQSLIQYEFTYIVEISYQSTSNGFAFGKRELQSARISTVKSRTKRKLMWFQWVSEWKKNSLCKKCAFEWQIFTVVEVRHYASSEQIFKGDWKVNAKYEKKRSKTITTSDDKTESILSEAKNLWKGMKSSTVFVQLNWKRNFSIVQSLNLKLFLSVIITRAFDGRFGFHEKA